MPFVLKKGATYTKLAILTNTSRKYSNSEREKDKSTIACPPCYLMYTEKLSHSWVIYVVILLSIQCPNIIRHTNILTTFGTKVSVCSCIDVTVWKILTANPTTKDTRRGGAAVFNTTISPSCIKSVTVSIVISTTLPFSLNKTS
jgi:hypothetical protein